MTPAKRLIAGLALMHSGAAWAELPRVPSERLERPSLELLEYLGEWRDDDGEWVDPEFLLQVGAEVSRPDQAPDREQNND